MVQETIKIDGMTCAHCVMVVRRALAAIPGVQASEVIVGSATVIYDERQVDPGRIVAAIEAAGYVPVP